MIRTRKEYGALAASSTESSSSSVSNYGLRRANDRIAFVPSTSPLRPYSSRIKLDGSIESARRAGIADAAKPRKAIVNIVQASTIGSPELA
jgi:hypothetical protein